MYKCIQQLKQDTPLEQNIFFSNLKQTNKKNNPCFSRKAFVAGQLDFLGAVTYFSFPMMQLCSRIQNFPARWNILSNIIEEHGQGSFAQTHKATFTAFLQQIGIGTTTIENHTYHPCIDIFNHTLHSICQSAHPYVGIACLGIIEDRFSEISFQIGSFLIDAKWVQPEHLQHYTTHKELDILHADDFYSIISPHWDTHSKDIKKGLQIGNYLLLHLYEQLYEIHQHKI